MATARTSKSEKPNVIRVVGAQSYWVGIESARTILLNHQNKIKVLYNETTAQVFMFAVLFITWNLEIKQVRIDSFPVILVE